MSRRVFLSSLPAKQLYLSDMTNLDISFPEELTSMFDRTIEFSTNIADLKNRKLSAQNNWLAPRFSYTLNHKFCSREAFAKVQSLFLLCNGRASAFNFLDVRDNHIDNQFLYAADGVQTKFQIYKNYAYGSYSFKRAIYNVSDATVFVNGNTISVDNYTVQNGLITFDNEHIPADGSVISITTDFMVHVHFCSDELKFQPRSFNKVEIEELKLEEVVL
ncbi:MAG: DUF2460 domain-containing protein [Rickettsiales bacterium]|nr:DUF2460 domain-containing protein [Rickettsiales bacterium]